MTSGELVHFLVALAPVLVVLVLLWLRVKSLTAGSAGLAAALLGAFLAFPISPEGSQTIARMLPMVIEVALILLGGVCMAEAMTRSGAQDRLAAWLYGEESTMNKFVALLLLVYGMTPFMESVTGFGLGVVITAPLLIRLGLSPAKAVVSGLLGLVLVPWGSLGPGTLVAAQLGGQSFSGLGIWSALLTLPVLLISMVAVLAINVGRPSLRQAALALTVILVEWAALLAVNRLAGPPLAGVIASLVVILLLIACTRILSGKPFPQPGRALLISLVPYAVLISGILAATALTAISGQAVPAWVSNPALWLLVAAAVSVAIPHLTPVEKLGIVRESTRRWVPIAGNAVVFMAMGIVMAACGMSELIAATAAHAGYGFIAAVPALGALGGYLTGSNTGAAAMFSAATTTAATSLGANPLIALAGQNTAGSFAIIASPPRIALAVGVSMPEGSVLSARNSVKLYAAVIMVALVLGATVLILA